MGRASPAAWGRSRARRRAAGPACIRCCRRRDRGRRARWPSPDRRAGDLRSATSGTSAASAWSSPSPTRLGASSAKRAAASRTYATRGPSALPLVLYDRNATRGESPISRVRSRAAASAIWASCSGRGLRHDGAVGEGEGRVVGEHHVERRAHQVHARRGADGPERRANRVARGTDRAGHGRVGLTQRHERRTEVDRDGGDVERVDAVHDAVRPAVAQELGDARKREMSGQAGSRRRPAGSARRSRRAEAARRPRGTRGSSPRRGRSASGAPAARWSSASGSSSVVPIGQCLGHGRVDQSRSRPLRIAPPRAPGSSSGR